MVGCKVFKILSHSIEQSVEQLQLALQEAACVDLCAQAVFPQNWHFLA